MAPRESLLTHATKAKGGNLHVILWSVNSSAECPQSQVVHTFARLLHALLFIGDEDRRLIIGRFIFHPGGVFGLVRPEKDTRAQNNRK
jgi:hypothetical protein